MKPAYLKVVSGKYGFRDEQCTEEVSIHTCIHGGGGEVGRWFGPIRPLLESFLYTLRPYTIPNTTILATHATNAIHATPATTATVTTPATHATFAP